MKNRPSIKNFDCDRAKTKKFTLELSGVDMAHLYMALNTYKALVRFHNCRDCRDRYDILFKRVKHYIESEVI